MTAELTKKNLFIRELEALPDRPELQYAFWFKCYVEVQGNPSVLHKRRDYMFARDYACTAVVILTSTLTVSLLLLLDTHILPFFGYQKNGYSEEWDALVSYTIFTAIQYALLRYVAARHGRQFMTTVLAVASTK